MTRPRRPSPDDATLVRALKFHRCPGVVLRDVEARYGVRPRDLRAARSRLAAASRWTDEDFVMSGLRGGAWLTVDDLRGWIDYLDHAIWPADVVRAALDRLLAAGRVARAGDRWRIRGDWP